jgi:hypothetical protein
MSDLFSLPVPKRGLYRELEEAPELVVENAAVVYVPSLREARMPDQPVGRQILTLALGAAIGGVISFSFQMIGDSNNRAAARRESRRIAATQLFQEVGGLIDARYYVLANRPADSSSAIRRWRARADSLNDLWHERIPTNVALMCDYFGESFAEALLKVSDDSNILEGSVVGDFARASANARHGIFLLELDLADELRRGDILDQDQLIGNCKKLAVPRA